MSMTADPYHSQKLLSKHKYIGTVAKNIKLVCKYHNQNASQNRYGYSYGVKKKTIERTEIAFVSP